MSRELRMVKSDWEHPRDNEGRYIPLFKDFNDVLSYWKEGKRQWENGFTVDWTVSMSYKNIYGWKPKSTLDEHYRSMTWEEFDSQEPKKEEFMPTWSEEEKTHFQMYETTSEGTPISPVCGSAEELAHWLADNKANTFADDTASYETGLHTIKGIGWAPSGVMKNGKIISGVLANTLL